MGCSTSKLDDVEVVQLCKDRKKFIKQAVEHWMKFASTHIAYIQAMKRVSAALREYIDGDEPRKFVLNSFATPAYTPIKDANANPGFISMSPNSFSVAPVKSETHRVEAYSPIHHFGMDSMFAMQSSPMRSSFFNYSPNNRPNYPPPSPSPQTSQWDFFWNPFSSLGYYEYPQ